MNALVDTSVWSLAFRRQAPPNVPETRALAALVSAGAARIVGVVRQELLSGIADAKVCAEVRERLRAFPDLRLSSDDFELAAEFSNRCRRRGVQGSATDFLLCAVAVRRRLAILTTDDDFRRFSEVLPIRLHKSPS